VLFWGIYDHQLVHPLLNIPCFKTAIIVSDTISTICWVEIIIDAKTFVEKKKKIVFHIALNASGKTEQPFFSMLELLIHHFGLKNLHLSPAASFLVFFTVRPLMTVFAQLLAAGSLGLVISAEGGERD